MTGRSVGSVSEAGAVGVRGTVGAWRLAGLALEHAVKVRDRLKPTGERHFVHPLRCGRQQLRGLLDSHAGDVVRERQPCRAAEDATEMVGTEPDTVCDLRNTKRLVKVGVDVFAGADDTGRSVLAGSGQIAIGQRREIEGKHPEQLPPEYLLHSDTKWRGVIDYIAGMSDQYALKTAEELSLLTPKSKP